MTMHPELRHALDIGASTLEVIELFTKHHGGPKEEQVDLRAYCCAGKTHSDYEFWNNWSPLAEHLPTYSLLELNAVCEPFLSIHKALTREVISWICDSKRRNNVYLIAEPRIPRLVAHEHSRAAVFANICSDAQRFGRFFNNHVPRFPYDIYPLSGELAAAYPPYRRSLARVLTDSPGIHELPLRVRFKKLISEPWKELEESHPQYSNTPPVIVLRWDSEWENEELLRSICEFGSHSSPLLWIISIDTSSKLPILDLLDPLAPFHYFRLPIRYTEAQVDTELVLYYKFDVLRHKHKEIFYDNEVWPSVGQMSRLIGIVAGVFEFVDVIIQFIDWTETGGPRAHLETFLAHMADSPSPSDEHPYSALDHFYISALSSIPSDLHPVMKRAFGIICYLKYCNSAELACLLSLGNTACLPHFKRFADIGTDGWLHKSSCTCLRRFIESPKRSGQFHIPESESRLAVFQACLHILRHSSDATILLKPKAVQWIEADQNAYCMQTKRLRPTACSTLCDIRGAGEEWISLLRCFDFRCLAHNCDYIFLHTFMEFLRHLCGLDKAHSPNIVRIKPASSLDRQFIDKCKGLAEPLDLEEGQSHFSNPKYVLLGYETRTVLAVLVKRKRDSHKTSGVTIYTSTMLEYM